ncbi:MAG: NADPH-dependent FMN reductase [Actinomycetota bacterium]
MTTLLAFSGSLRAASFNSRVIRALPALAPEGVDIVQFDVTDLPFYNQDLDGETVPDVVAALRAAVAEAEGVVIASPEYNHSYSAVAKNIVDWASRPMMQGPILGKKSMVIAVGPGPGGGKHCLEDLGKLLGLLGGTVVASVGAAKVHEKFAPDSDVIIDAEFAAELRNGLAAF